LRRPESIQPRPGYEPGEVRPAAAAIAGGNERRSSTPQAPPGSRTRRRRLRRPACASGARSVDAVDGPDGA